jgi:hypothetical protein
MSGGLKHMVVLAFFCMGCRLQGALVAFEQQASLHFAQYRKQVRETTAMNREGHQTKYCGANWLQDGVW